MRWRRIFNRFTFLKRRWKRTQIDKDGFLYTFRPIYIYSRAFGALPFSIFKNENGDVQRADVSVFDFIWFLVSTCLYIFFFFASYQQFKRIQESKDSNVLMLGSRVRLFSGLFFGVIIIVLDMCSRFVNILKKFISFDNEVSSKCATNEKIQKKNRSILKFCFYLKYFTIYYYL